MIVACDQAVVPRMCVQSWYEVYFDSEIGIMITVFRCLCPWLSSLLP